MRGSGVEPTTAASAGLGVSAFMKAGLGVRLAAGAFLAAAFFFAAADVGAASAVFVAGALAGAFFAVAIKKVLRELVLSPAKNHVPTGSAHATGEKCAFQVNAGKSHTQIFIKTVPKFSIFRVLGSRDPLIDIGLMARPSRFNLASMHA